MRLPMSAAKHQIPCVTLVSVVPSAALLSVPSDSFGVMSSSGIVDREAITAAVDALDAAFEKAATLDCEALATRELLSVAGTQ